MYWLQILEQYGIQVVVAIAFGFFIWKQNQFIQKKMQIEQKGIEKSYKGLVDIISKLIHKNGNGFKSKLEKFLKDN